MLEISRQILAPVPHILLFPYIPNTPEWNNCSPGAEGKNWYTATN